MDVLPTVRTVALKRPILNQKKGPRPLPVPVAKTTAPLTHLNLPSRDTVPLFEGPSQLPLCTLIQTF
jgi:hypothetical protein